MPSLPTTFRMMPAQTNDSKDYATRHTSCADHTSVAFCHTEVLLTQARPSQLLTDGNRTMLFTPRRTSLGHRGATSLILWLVTWQASNSEPASGLCSGVGPGELQAELGISTASHHEHSRLEEWCPARWPCFFSPATLDKMQLHAASSLVSAGLMLFAGVHQEIAHVIMGMHHGDLARLCGANVGGMGSGWGHLKMKLHVARFFLCLCFKRLSCLAHSFTSWVPRTSSQFIRIAG